MPAETPVTVPLELPTITRPLALLHVPPAGVEFNVVVDKTQTDITPPIAVGLAFTVTTYVVKADPHEALVTV